ncbi:hypothetical protein RhiXN_07661 [Rhizoctonia solani]|uniref:Uncharacterized protein n=1 Tax=Rhizoctonia solani TaxID=456999 RepID=A0A8H8P036_9AGAM|nr:uncharacterized protein RhiXN_07661 [Rhizoctonia solani]QRW22625.1 hypothetical protein RhiXN_07661 [Rhizoctonia solani]
MSRATSKSTLPQDNPIGYSGLILVPGTKPTRPWVNIRPEAKSSEEISSDVPCSDLFEEWICVPEDNKPCELISSEINMNGGNMSSVKPSTVSSNVSTPSTCTRTGALRDLVQYGSNSAGESQKGPLPSGQTSDQDSQAAALKVGYKTPLDHAVASRTRNSLPAEDVLRYQ